ncbi:unnamed protein product, partial [Didymodactylos carnosus]
DDELDIALYDAIRFDSVRFADLFVEYGANFENLKGIIDMDDMNEFYLNHNEIVAELVACRIFDQAAEMEFRSDMKKHFTLFKKLCDKRAAVVIDKCYKEDEKLALRLLKAKSDLFFNYSLIELATENRCRAREFVASETVKRYIDQKWFGEMIERRHRIRTLEVLVSDSDEM